VTQSRPCGLLSEVGTGVKGDGSDRLADITELVRWGSTPAGTCIIRHLRNIERPPFNISTVGKQTGFPVSNANFWNSFPISITCDICTVARDIQTAS